MSGTIRSVAHAQADVFRHGKATAAAIEFLAAITTRITAPASSAQGIVYPNTGNKPRALIHFYSNDSVVGYVQVVGYQSVEDTTTRMPTLLAELTPEVIDLAGGTGADPGPTQKLSSKLTVNYMIDQPVVATPAAFAAQGDCAPVGVIVPTLGMPLVHVLHYIVSGDGTTLRSVLAFID